MRTPAHPFHRHAGPLVAAAALWLLAVALLAGPVAAQATTKTRTFTGVKANTGFATLATAGGKATLTWSDDFTIPDSPAPHWEVVDAKGRTYLLQRLKIKDDRFNRTITLPDYVKDVATVRIWCAWAEVVLGEAPLEKAVEL
jgi:hypothetical protein